MDCRYCGVTCHSHDCLIVHQAFWCYPGLHPGAPMSDPVSCDYCARAPERFQTCTDCGMLFCMRCKEEHLRHQRVSRWGVRSLRDRGPVNEGIVAAIYRRLGDGARPLDAATSEEEYERRRKTQKGVPRAVSAAGAQGEVLAAARESNRCDAGRSGYTAEDDVRRIGRVMEQRTQASQALTQGLGATDGRASGMIGKSASTPSDSGSHSRPAPPQDSPASDEAAFVAAAQRALGKINDLSLIHI